ncbi:M23 family metallopeptidase [Pseudomonadota bacterium]
MRKMASRYLRQSASLLAILVLALPLVAESGMRGSGRGENFVEGRDANVQATDLVPLFPEGYACEKISSPYGSPYRYDGSQRRKNRNKGLHGGMDLSLDEGTSLLAVAGGSIIATGEGGRLEGIYLWLRHAPTDTGLPYWIFSKYQHLSELPTLKPGDQAEAGQVVALSGKTGTTGGHFGYAGYPHLHLSIYIGPSDRYEQAGTYGSMIRAKGAKSADPMVLYLSELQDLDAAASLPDEQKQVPVAVVGENGSMQPLASKVVWPVQCVKDTRKLKHLH